VVVSGGLDGIYIVVVSGDINVGWDIHSGGGLWVDIRVGWDIYSGGECCVVSGELRCK
jgi:hypothetical protein